MQEFILTTPERLSEIVEQAIKRTLPTKLEERPQEMPESCSFSQALVYLAEQGYELSKSKLYKLTSLKKVPFRYFGRKIVFSRDELLQWVKTQTMPSANSSEILLSLAKSARHKSRK